MKNVRYIRAALSEEEIRDMKIKRGVGGQKRKSIISEVSNAPDNDKIQMLFDKLVPSSGPAESVAGEYVRAMMRILYRDYNDGDCFYKGYGIETCGNAAAYLKNECPSFVGNALEEIAERQLTEGAYTAAIEKLAVNLSNYILSNSKLMTTLNIDDCLEYDGEEEWKGYEPRYDFELYIPEEVEEHLDEGHITFQDIVATVESWIEYESWCDSETYVDESWGSIVIHELTEDGYEAMQDWERSGRMWVDYIEELDAEFPFDDEEEEEDE